LKQAFQNDIIQDGHVWIAALEHRNETVHLYDAEKIKAIEAKIKKITRLF
jgi:Nucleotidyltransferase substrate binding protein like